MREPARHLPNPPPMADLGSMIHTTARVRYGGPYQKELLTAFDLLPFDFFLAFFTELTL